MLTELNPTVDQLATLSTKLIGYSRQRQFYKTLHDVLMVYTGTNKLINDYINVPNRAKVTFESKYSSKFTEDEFKAIKDMEDILPKIFSYKFYTFLKMGLINLYTEQGTVKFQPLAFDKSLLREIMNNRRIKAISTKDFTPYIQDSFVTSFDNIIGACILFGHLTSVAVVGEGRRTIYTKAPASILSRFANGNYLHHTNPLRYSTRYGSDVKTFLDNYHVGAVTQDVRIVNNIVGKTAIMKGFSRLLADSISPSVIRLAGEQLGIDAFQDNPEVWSEKNTIYGFYQIFDKLLNPGKDSETTQDVRDPTLRLSQIYSGRRQAVDYRISDLEARSGKTLPFWKGDFGELHLTYPTLTHYFGNDFYKIQPALYYREYNINNIIHSKDLSLQHLLAVENSKFIHNIDHLYKKLYDVLKDNYGNNEEIKATFHMEKSMGLGEKTKIYNSLATKFKKLFADLIPKNHNSLSFTMRKHDGGKVVNDAEFKRFVLSITFYLVMFNAFGIIGDDNLGYRLFATQRKLYNNDYITGLYSKDNLKTRLSPVGQQIYNGLQAQWNQDDEGRTVWNLEDCWPIYLFEDVRDLITFFQDTYNVRIRPLET